MISKIILINIKIPFRLGFEAPGNYNLSDFYIQTLAIVPFDRETSLERVAVIFIRSYQILFN